MANKMGFPVTPTIYNWFSSPQPQYVPLADVAFAPPEIIMPHALPPTSMQFPNAMSNKMLNIPSVATAYDVGRTGRIF